MTDHKHLKARVRARMARTGERYAAARAHVVAAAGSAPTGPAAADAGSDVLHLAGADPETTGLRILLAVAGVRDAAGAPLPDPTALVIGGGIGIGVFAFHYEKEGFSSFFLAGRHGWDDARAYLDGAVRRLGRQPIFAEATSPTVGARRLAEALANGPAIAWVDVGELGTRGYPPEMTGGGYHSLVVHALDEWAGTALVSDLAEQPLTIPLETLARARARIGKFKQRLLTIEAAEVRRPDLPAAIRAGLAATVRGLDEPRTRNFSLAALGDWAARLRGDGRDSWSRVFPTGEWLWVGLAAIHEFVEHYGSGGGLARPRFAAGLRDAAERLGDDRLLEPAERYEALGAAWSSLAMAALPDEVPALRRTRLAQDRRAAAYRDGGAGPDARPNPEVVAAWRDLDEIRVQMREAFPLDDTDAARLRAGLADRVEAIHADEVEALASLRRAIGA